jgi:tRNA A37 N6-isopentenylltransferase MiaA
MSVKVLATEDLEEFKRELLDEIKSLFKESNEPTSQKWSDHRCQKAAQHFTGAFSRTSCSNEQFRQYERIYRW